MLKLWVRKYLQFYAENVCLSKPVSLRLHFLLRLDFYSVLATVNLNWHFNDKTNLVNSVKLFGHTNNDAFTFAFRVELVSNQHNFTLITGTNSPGKSAETLWSLVRIAIWNTSRLVRSQ